VEAPADVAAIDPLRGPAPPRPLLLAVVAEHEWAASFHGGRRRWIGTRYGCRPHPHPYPAARGGGVGSGFMDPRAERATIPAGGNGLQRPRPPKTWRPSGGPIRLSRGERRGVRRPTPRRWRATARPTPMGLAVWCEVRSRGRSVATDPF